MKKIERDCDNCIRKNPGSGCSSWDCDPITREEAIDAVEAQRKLRKREQMTLFDIPRKRY